MGKKSYRFEEYSTEYGTAYLTLVTVYGKMVTWRASVDFRWNMTEATNPRGQRVMRPGVRKLFNDIADAYDQYEEYVERVKAETLRCTWEGPVWPTSASPM